MEDLVFRESLPMNSKKNKFTENVKYLKEEEYKKLISNAKPFYKLVYLFLFETGSRISEARLVKFSDIDFRNRRIKVATLKQKNSDAYRILYISRNLMSLILLHQKERNLSDQDYVLAKFPNRNAITQQSVDEMMRKDLKKLNIPVSGGPHLWRHTRVIMLLDSGMDIVKLKSFLGHSDLKNTLIYLKYSNAALKESIDKANKIIGL